MPTFEHFPILMEEIEELDGQVFPMVGLFSMKARMAHRLKALGYRKIRTLEDSILGPVNTVIRGHEFHYSHAQNIAANMRCVYNLTDRKAVSREKEGFTRKNVLGSYVHLHWGSNPEVARNFVDYCHQCGDSTGAQS